MTSFYELTEPLFEKAKALMDSSGPRTEYMASAVYAADGYYYAAYAAPGWVPEFVYDDQGPSIFQEIKDAEARAREMLFNTLNANLVHGWTDGIWIPRNRPTVS